MGTGGVEPPVSARLKSSGRMKDPELAYSTRERPAGAWASWGGGEVRPGRAREVAGSVRGVRGRQCALASPGRAGITSLAGSGEFEANCPAKKLGGRKQEKVWVHDCTHV